ncbi:hypothetical protein [Mucilaginibacter sp. 22184]|uniref:hypothetical protein n=1 Tax=Mucilaginibacter sp. 22184 TaxID=3453887 RepID=UPI003F868D9F
MQPSLEQLAITYKNLPADKLIRLAVTDAAGLRPEALELLKAEIKGRGLDDGILRGIDVQLNHIDDSQLNNYLALVRNQACPTCGDQSQQLNAVLSTTVISAIIFTHYKKAFSIGCPTCLKRANQKATLKTALLGWWGLPWGIIRTPQALISNTKTNKRINTGEPTPILVDFIKNNIGIIESIKNNDQSLQVMLTNLNNKQHYNK